MTTKHTPGPWEVTDLPVMTNIGYGHYVGRKHGWAVAHICNLAESDGGIETRRANANLIAACPDLLAALEEIVERRENVCKSQGRPDKADGSDGRYARARAAIAKARGVTT